MTGLKLQERASSLSFTSEDFDQSAYASVSRRAKLVDIILAKHDYSIKLPDILDREAIESDAHSFSGAPSGYHFDPEDGVLIGQYDWAAEIKRGRRKILKLAVSYTLIYNNLRDEKEDYVQLYFDKIARFTSYPYFRTIFAMNTSNSGLRLEPLPSLNERVD